MRALRFTIFYLLGTSVAGCTPDGVPAIVDPSRSGHFLDAPFPSDDLIGAGGFPDLAGFPVATEELAGGIVDGWRRRIERTTQGFANNGAAYFRFEGALAVPESTQGDPEDPVLLVAMDGSELIPLTMRFVADPQGDPFYADNTLALAPALGHPPKSGGRYAAVVMRSAGAASPEDYELPDGVQDALDEAGVKGKAAVATVFTVQDGTDQLRQLAADADSRVGDWGDPGFRRVVRVAVAQGETPSGNAATAYTVTFEGGGTETTYLGAVEDGPSYEIDLVADWPMVVYQGSIPIWNYQGMEDRPYMSPGITHVLDAERMTGWIDFEDGALTSVPEREMMRIVVSIPKGEDGRPRQNVPVLIRDHGTGGHAYNAVQRRNPDDEGITLAQILADENWAIIGRDATLYGLRYPLMDEGYGSTLGFYNIVNLPAFRDNQRQTAIEGHMLKRFVEQALNDTLPDGSVDATRFRRYGHSLGSVTSNLGMAADPDGYETVFLDGSGGVFTHYFLDTGMLDDLDPSLVTSLFGLVGKEPPEDVTPSNALAALLGLPEPAWGNIDRLHPVITLFQWTMDPSDPMAVARDEALPARMLICVGDRQVPNFTSRALVEALPDASAFEVEATADYDPHQCLQREDPAQEGFADWLAGP